jgi:uncharacterized protein (TIGR03437 family)
MGSGGQIYFSVPGSLAPGPVVVQLTSPGGSQIPPILMQVDPPPPIILAATNAAGVLIDQTHPVKAGDAVTITVFGLLDGGNPPAASSVVIGVGGINQGPSAVLPSTTPGAVQLSFALSSNVPPGNNVPLTVALGTRVSIQPFTIPVRQQ